MKKKKRESFMRDLRERVCDQNRRLYELGLVILTEGNVSERRNRHMAIKPSGVPYEKMNPDDIVVVNIETGRVEYGDLAPSVDTPIHLEIYRRLPKFGAIAHTHSDCATIFAQLGKAIPCYGTTHADAFNGEVPVTNVMSREELAENYAMKVAEKMVEVLRPGVEAVLINCHGPFTFGSIATEAVNNALILEKVARMALPCQEKDSIPMYLLDMHYGRKHGPNKTYGQRHR